MGHGGRPDPYLLLVRFRPFRGGFTHEKNDRIVNHTIPQ